MGRPFKRSLAEAYPLVASEWHPGRNGVLSPHKTAPSSRIPVWWRCARDAGHEWRTAPKKRVVDGSGCPFCAGQRISAARSLAGRFPKLAAEWHMGRNGGHSPSDISVNETEKYWWRCARNPAHEWLDAPRNRVRHGTGCPQCALEGRSIASHFPALLAEWHPTKNGSVSPHTTAFTSREHAWWLCPKNSLHEWSAQIRTRTIGGCGCPFCAHRRVNPSNSLATLAPVIAAEWHPDRNGALTAHMVGTGSHRVVWWRCGRDQSHSWEAEVRLRVEGIGSCPACKAAGFIPRTQPSGRPRKKRERSSPPLAVSFPAIAAQWHPTRNGSLTPSEVWARDVVVAWWKCSKGTDHEWQTKVVSRVSGGGGCPFCLGRRLSRSNSLALQHPDFASEWHPTKNSGLSPADVVAGSHRRVWWKCAKGPDHEWCAGIKDRAGKRRLGCPFCAGLKVSVSNSLASLRPDLAEQWHPSLNGEVTPSDVVVGSERKRWWLCPEGPDHEWQATPALRARAGTGCAVCAGRRVVESNSIVRTHPKIAAQWHPERNGSLLPNQVVAGSSRKVWWQCKAGQDHEWITKVAHRTGVGSGCPFCTLVPRSAQEVLLAFELQLFLPFDLNVHRVQAGSKVLDCDIVIPQYRLIVEFDGSYWHAKSRDSDRRKTEALVAAGWKVIRVREAPLKRLHANDVVKPLRAGMKACSDLVLTKAAHILRRRIPGLAAYLRKPRLQNQENAVQYIERLLAKRGARKGRTLLAS